MSIRHTADEIRAELTEVEQELDQLREDARERRAPMGVATRISDLEEQRDNLEHLLRVKTT